MSRHRSRNYLTLLLIFGAVVFGMVLAGGLDLTVPGVGSPEPTPADDGPIRPAAPAEGLPSFANLAEQVSPAVVSIEAAYFERSRRRSVDPFEFFFGPRRRGQPEPDDDEEYRADSGGSGFVVSGDGLIVTNNHVIKGAEKLRVHLGDKTYDAEVKGADPATDLALLSIDAPEDLPYLALGNSDALRVGDWVMAIGSPLGLANTVTVGVVSAKQRQINISPDTSSFESFIQTDAAINFGNSGGPLINLRGEVIGINTAINYGSENIGFAVPVNFLKQILPQLKESGRVRRGYLGIEVREVSQNAAEAFGLDAAEGALVANVLPGLPADRGGLRHGDVILKVDDRKVGTTRDLIDYVSAQGPDATVALEIIREGERIVKKVKLAERPLADSEIAETPEESEAGIEWLGIKYQGLTPGLRSMHGLPEDLEGVWITEVSPRSPLFDEGLRTNGVLNVATEVNGRKVDGVEPFESVIRDAESGSRLRLYIRRFGRGQEIQPLYLFPAKP